MKSIKELSIEIGQWASANFGNTPTNLLRIVNEHGVHQKVTAYNTFTELNWMAPLMGLVEEMGELQKARGEDNIEETIDAIADMGIYFCDYLYRIKLDNFDFSLDAYEIQRGRRSIALVGTIGGLYHIHLKRFQKIRGYDKPEQFDREHQKLCGQLWNVLDNFSEEYACCTIETTIEYTFTSIVSKRDWKKFSETGTDSQNNRA